ncbi:hypothetical protein BLA9940_04236 [Burkholderia aenigmatica]|uniref:Uncharacterized protein n=1 Tax=Burkholderia aenigmatica TaxID=2015348 RepID=A0A6J5IM36_9BURK|nr:MULTISPECIES: hypothetical protein [Burkholderia]AYQ42615.1 hypothetical protein CVS37_32940 [Burkholderia lata]MCA8294217.1 hypothetical protein [Burkholderia sp. AU30198]UKD14440.1 hypothetical protein L3V59_32770 [Burkholderia aenigmatica]CAB3960675.1 hypothetical protein BLA3211_00413 [Burkholderia aenigmatica]VWC73142.1 hypothetical protein BLA9940_04236 [Burkholderia aenigmatica]
MLTYSIQKVGYQFDQLDSQGATDYPSFTQAFDVFPWAAQHAEWDDTQEGPLPALVLQHADDQRELWVTALSDAHADGFQLNAVSMRMKKGLFGIGKGKLEQHVDTIDVDTRADVDTLCRLFCDRQYDELDRLVARHAERNRFDDDSDD